MVQTLMIIGLGDVGGNALEFLARTPSVGRIIAADYNSDWGVRKTNNAVMGAALQGFYPHIEFVKINLNDVEATAETLLKYKPDLIFAGVSLLSWWVRRLLPVSERIVEAGSGPWLPVQLKLTLKLMKAVRKSGITAHVINASFPDATNMVLSKVGPAPTVGIGNLDLVIPLIQSAVAKKLGVPMHNVKIYMVGHHFHDVSIEERGSAGGAPYFIKILVAGDDVTNKLDIDDVFSACKIPLPDPTKAAMPVASSAVKNILAILNDTGLLTHAPGPLGLPGGYPVRLSAKGAEVVLPAEISLKEAVKINEAAQKFDGIETIKDDGTIVLTEKSLKIMSEVFGYTYDQVRVNEIDERADELFSRFKALADKYGTAIPTYT